MVYDNKNVVLNELIGLKVVVLESLDKRQKGLRGRVVDESKNTLLIETEKGRKRVVKKISVFRFYPGRKSFRVDGNEINFRPFERTEKAIKFYRMRKKENK